MTIGLRVLLALALLASALGAGFFYTYSISVMPGLAAADPAAAIRAMQGINATIRTAVFAFAFFGALALPLAAAAAGLAAGHRDVALLALAAAAIDGLGVVGTTFLVNVPMNEALAAVVPGADAAAVWAAYAGPWTAWNHVRTLAALAALGCVGWAVVREARYSPGVQGT